MKTPDEIDAIISAKVDAELPRPVGGFENDDDAYEWQSKKEERFMELARDFSDDSDNTFSVNFSRGDQIAEAAATFTTLSQAVEFAVNEAKSYADHVDFKNGVFEVWKHTTSYSSFGEDHLLFAAYPVGK